MAKHTLLMIDRDVYYASIYANRFEAAGWKVVVEDDFAGAKKRIARSVPDVVIADLHPREEALSFFTELRSSPRTTQVLQVALTELGDRELMNKALEAGVDSYILKGHFVPAEAVKKVKRLLADKQSV